MWWKETVVYQIYPRSFQDTNGDGVGDLEGIRRRLNYLKSLGVGAIWLSPFYKSPMKDFGYDVADYCQVDPIFGTLEDFDRLLKEAHALGIKVLIDLVPNHTSDQHPWFLESRGSRDNPKRNWYIWKDPAPGGGPPNNWQSFFGGPAWTLDERTGQYYLHLFLPEQPDLNWQNPEVREAIYEAMRFWLKRGVDGFRVDVLWLLAKDPLFRDEPGNPEWRPGLPDRLRHDHLFTEDQPETYAYVREMRQVLDQFSEPGGERVMVGEIYLPLHRLVRYYRAGCHLPFNFSLITEGLPHWRPENLARLVEAYESLLTPWDWPNWVLGNHDQPRLASRLGEAQARVAAMLLFTLRGTPTWYYGDELALPNGEIPPNKVQDPAALRQKDRTPAGYHSLGRDPERTPMPWDTSPYAGFSTVEPWLPLNPDWPVRNVAVQEKDPRSMLQLVKRLIALRQDPGLLLGSYRTYRAGNGIYAYLRGEGLLVALNFTDRERALELPQKGQVVLSTHLDREEAVGNILRLRPDEGAVIRLG
ncbi:alpha-amylase family glycosyl hydrolase [Thermus caldilimi]|uniref:alpha-amylase family glycosyl hydrolase n=1 Tax=Thermus caldilimi TaxID=2483360 RepID=UPI00107611A4|nr:alpha-amylase family glycosyl hydrolase [Thermus caldilimi]